jgi:hypothetical protein
LTLVRSATVLALAASMIAPGCGASPAARHREEMAAESTAATSGASGGSAVVMSGPPAALEVTQPQTEILGSDGVNVAIRSRILVTNPNPYPITLRVLDGVLWLDGAQAATARIEGEDVLDAREARVFQLDANVPVQLIMTVRSRTYVSSGSITATAPDGTSFASPFSFEGPLPM